MCGVAGELRFDGGNPATFANRALRAIARRGPNCRKIFVENPVALCHTRMAIIDLSDRSDQPMTDSTAGLSLVFNGSIYNYPELRRELLLLGHRFVSSGDTEVILKAYAQWGEDCVERLDGVFAFAIWDTTRQSLFLARDHLGVKPMYYSLGANAFRFASNPQALLIGGGVDTSIDPRALHHHLTLHAVVPPPDTLLKGVKKLAPATTLSVSRDGKIRERTYWRLSARRPETPLSEDAWREKIGRLLREAVIRRYEITDVPIGVLLSGGLDSSVILAILEQAGKDVRTWSIGFESAGGESGDEFHYSDMLVDRYKTRHTRIVIDNPELSDMLPGTIKQMPEPMVGQDCVAFYTLSKHVRRDIRVVQCGQGADELFGGYFWYPLMDEATGSPLERFRAHYFDRTHEEYLRAVTPDYHTPDVTAETVSRLLESADADTFMDAVWQTDMTTLIVDDPVKRVDSMTMAWGLEARTPFLDVSLVEAVMQAPPELKVARPDDAVGAPIGKYLLKQIARDLVPAEIINRKKEYFPVPALKHHDRQTTDMLRDVLNSEACRTRGLFERAYIDELLSQPQFTPIRGNKLWHHALLEMWLQTHVDNAPAHDLTASERAA